jgi:hypothetical protein
MVQQVQNPWHYAREKLAVEYVSRIKDSLFSRLALIGSRRIGKTAFILNDLAPALLTSDCIPVYISLWSDKTAPHHEFIEKLTHAVDALKDGSFKRLLTSEINSLTIGGNLLGKIEVDLRNEQADGGALQLIRSSLNELIKIADNKRVVLMLDEIQHLVTDKAFDSLQYALRSILDEVGARISVVYTGSSRGGMTAMFQNRDLPFYHSAQPTEFPIIDDGFVDFCLNQLKTYDLHYDRGELLAFWNSVDKSPFWMIELMRELVLKKCGLSIATNLVRMRIEADGSFKALLRNMTKAEKLTLILLSDSQKLYAVSTADFFNKYRIRHTRSLVQTSITRLVTKRIITKLPDGSYLIETEGLVAAIKRELDGT